MKKINPKIFSKLKKKYPSKTENAIRVKLSKLSRKYNITLNAAAEIWAKKEGFSVWGLLKDSDKEGLPKNFEIVKAHKSKIKKHFKRAEYKEVGPLKYSKEASQMIEAYRWIFCLENTIRDFLRNIFRKEKDWLDKRLDKEIKKDIKRAKKEPYYAHKRAKDDLEYVTLGHLQKIIISNKNWEDLSSFLKEKNKKEFVSTFKKVLPSRNSTAHCIALPPKDIKWIEFRVREVASMFKF